MSKMVLRNNVEDVLRKKDLVLTKDLNVSSETIECTLQQRLVRMNSSRDLMYVETVLCLPAKDEIWQLAISEPYTKFDFATFSRNYQEAFQMAGYQWATYMDGFFEIEGCVDLKNVEDLLPIFRTCDYFDINSEEYSIKHLVLADRWVVYGRGKAWDYGSSEDSEQRAYEKMKWIVADYQKKEKEAEEVEAINPQI